jgi:esterase/lipase superfamily enzyme
MGFKIEINAAMQKGALMNITETTIRSKVSDFELDAIVYGDKGTPVVVLPTFDSSCSAWEAAGLLDVLEEQIEAGRMRLVALDSLDDRGWYAYHSDLAYRTEGIGAYLSFLTDELPDQLCDLCATKAKPILAGCEVGATNALAAVLIRPAVFAGALLMSGVYDAREFTDGATNDVLLACSPVDLAADLTKRQVTSLSKLRLAFVSERTPEEWGCATQRRMQEQFDKLGIDATFEYWDDAERAWPVWAEMVRQLLPAVVAKDGLAKRRAEQEEQRVKRAQERLAAAERVAAEAQATLDEAADRLAAEQEGVERCEKAHDAATSAAQKAWDARNEAQAKLTALDNKAQQAQHEADEAAGALANARWYVGEAEAAVAQAEQALASATALVEAARADL